MKTSVVVLLCVTVPRFQNRKKEVKTKNNIQLTKMDEQRKLLPYFD